MQDIAKKRWTPEKVSMPLEFNSGEWVLEKYSDFNYFMIEVIQWSWRDKGGWKYGDRYTCELIEAKNLIKIASPKFMCGQGDPSNTIEKCMYSQMGWLYKLRRHGWVGERALVDLNITERNARHDEARSGD